MLGIIRQARAHRRKLMIFAGTGVAILAISAVVCFFYCPIAPDFDLRTPDGKHVELSSLRGKVVLLDFWTTGCCPCNRQFPALEKLQASFHGRGLHVLAVNVGGDPNCVRNYMKRRAQSRKERGLPPSAAFATVIDSGTISKRYGADKFPLLALVDRKGRLVDRFEGETDGGKLASRIERLLKR